MSVLQQTPSVASFGSPAPPPYTAEVQPQQAQNAFGQVQPQQQNGFPQAQGQMEPQQFQSSVQDPQFVPQGPPTQPMMGQQPLQYPPNMTAQQQQQVAQIIQSMPPEKVQILQQQAQQMMAPRQIASPQQMMSPQSFQQPQPMMPQPQPMVQQPIPQQPVQQPGQKLHYTTSAPSGLFGPKHSSGGHGGQTGPKDEKQTGGVQRFFGDTLFGRVARSSVQTATSALKMPSSLSPWGDNNPVTLPNVRYRDAVYVTPEDKPHVLRHLCLSFTDFVCRL
jgi:hypothetical protein